VQCALNPYDTNPQGIADPPPAGTGLATVTTHASRGMPSVAATHTASTVGPESATVNPTLAGRDALFVLLDREPLSRSGESAIDATAGGGLTFGREGSIPGMARALNPTSASL
jgi:hypothetical protein